MLVTEVKKSIHSSTPYFREARITTLEMPLYLRSIFQERYRLTPAAFFFWHFMLAVSARNLLMKVFQRKILVVFYQSLTILQVDLLSVPRRYLFLESSAGCKCLLQIFTVECDRNITLLTTHYAGVAWLVHESCRMFPSMDPAIRVDLWKGAAEDDRTEYIMIKISAPG